MDVGQRGTVFAIAFCRQAQRRRKERPRAFHGIIAADLQRMPDRFGIAFQVSGEQHLRGDVEREPHEVWHHIKNFIFRGIALPAAQHDQRIFRHGAYE